MGVYIYLVIVYLVSCLFCIYTMYFLFSYMEFVALAMECSPTSGLAHTALMGPIHFLMLPHFVFGDERGAGL